MWTAEHFKHAQSLILDGQATPADLKALREGIPQALSSAEEIDINYFANLLSEAKNIPALMAVVPEAIRAGVDQLLINAAAEQNRYVYIEAFPKILKLIKDTPALMAVITPEDVKSILDLQFKREYVAGYVRSLVEIKDDTLLMAAVTPDDIEKLIRRIFAKGYITDLGELLLVIKGYPALMEVVPKAVEDGIAAQVDRGTIGYIARVLAVTKDYSTVGAVIKPEHVKAVIEMTLSSRAAGSMDDYKSALLAIRGNQAFEAVAREALIAFEASQKTSGGTSPLTPVRQHYEMGCR
ncbi:MAG: hypothetical protein AB7G80_07025 [Dongiaceae bacterium]